MEECPICLMESDENYIPFQCNHSYHENCIKKLNNFNIKKSNKCLLCMKDIKDSYKKIFKTKLNYVFNNMLIGYRDFNVDLCLKEWKNIECIENNHKITMETLGDWDMLDNNREFIYRCMYISCDICNKSIIVK